jgi:hypothetical protein
VYDAILVRGTVGGAESERMGREQRHQIHNGTRLPMIAELLTGPK